MTEEASGDLRLTWVAKTYDSFTAVDQLDLVIPRGSFFALLGTQRKINTVFQSYALFPHLTVLDNGQEPWWPECRAQCPRREPATAG